MATPLIERDRETYTVTRDPRTFVSPEVWDREVTLLMRDYPFDKVMAERLFAGAVSYLITAMEKFGQGLEMCCGRIVDIAVHVFILDTRNYREFCETNFGGRFLEHIPEIEFKHDGSVERTAHIIADNGFPVDWPLWEADFAKCGPCHPGASCH
ncbi:MULTISPECIES: hypothetical protein [unclassified Streptomyces]|uniref:Uncharacterized protein n=1 Tax=Streptomyces castrisilvae TaxID=3033811 RepID=A0ABY9HYL1_9ACTN|nr:MULTISPECIES: hypothetical protein [unclassified Streptomyces]MYY03352.1 hypothetical protein [Streptomyces sp. SID4913]WLQ38491.1 hypothetical protein P8A18_33795 [Streptomyces sp. Mut1]